MYIRGLPRSLEYLHMYIFLQYKLLVRFMASRRISHIPTGLTFAWSGFGPTQLWDRQQKDEILRVIALRAKAESYIIAIAVQVLSY